MAPSSVALDRGMLRGVAGLRGLTLVWAWAGLLFERGQLDRPLLAVVALLGATAMTGAATVAVERGVDPGALRVLAGLEIVIAIAVLVADGVVYDVGREQSLPWAWPAAGIVAVSVMAGLVPGLAASVAVAVASFAGESLLRDEWQWSGTTASKSALFVLAAVVGHQIASRLRAAESEIVATRARAEVARELHDGVLQTLAVVQRRGADPSLVELARDQERDLRAYLAGEGRSRSDLSAAIREVISTARRRYSVEIRDAVASDLPAAPQLASPLASALAEALANAGKHAAATRIVVFAEPTDDGGVFASVRDDGIGFEREAVHVRGLAGSLEAPVAALGGRVEIDSSPGRGTEVRVWLT